jgi:hypothetical protein
LRGDGSVLEQLRQDLLPNGRWFLLARAAKGREHVPR